MLARTVGQLLACPAIDGIRIVAEDGETYRSAVGGFDLPDPTPGGATRQESVRNGLEAIAAEDGCARVLIHDAARPFVDAALVGRVLAALEHDDGAIPALAVVDSLRTGGSHVAGDVARDGLWRVQPPQGFRFEAILAAHRAAAPGATDDAAVLRAGGGRVALVAGDERNFKITTAEDFERAEQQLAASLVSRTASGFDVHRFGPGDHVWLCGVRVPHGFGLVGHSDADAGLHALTDALLGCIGAGDIGDHFPPSDPQWKGVSSDRFLAHARDLVEARGGRIDHVDVTLICEAPKVGPHREAMRQRLQALLGLAPGAVSVKATTTEGLGFTGRREGIAAQAVATIRIPAG